MLALGYGPKEASLVLYKSEKTLYTQFERAMAKLGLQSLNQLTVYACRWFGPAEP